MDTINDKKLIEAVAKRTGNTMKDTKPIIVDALAFIGESLKNGDRISLNGFGIFETVEKEAREAKAFGKDIIIPAQKQVKFKPSKSLKDIVNG